MAVKKINWIIFEKDDRNLEIYATVKISILKIVKIHLQIAFTRSKIASFGIQIVKIHICFTFGQRDVINL